MDILKNMKKEIGKISDRLDKIETKLNITDETKDWKFRDVKAGDYVRVRFDNGNEMSIKVISSHGCSFCLDIPEDITTSSNYFHKSNGQRANGLGGITCLYKVTKPLYQKDNWIIKDLFIGEIVRVVNWDGNVMYCKVSDIVKCLDDIICYVKDIKDEMYTFSLKTGKGDLSNYHIEKITTLSFNEAFDLLDSTMVKAIS